MPDATDTQTTPDTDPIVASAPDSGAAPETRSPSEAFEEQKLEEQRRASWRAVVVERVSARDAIVLVTRAAWTGRCATSAALGAEVEVEIAAIDPAGGRAKVRAATPP